MLGRILLGFVALVLVVAVVGWFTLKRDDIPYETLEARYATPTSHYIDLPGGFRAHYRDDGPADAPVVLLVHGFGDSFLSWADWIDVLKQDFRVITVDVPGHGLTRAPDGYVPQGDAFVQYLNDFTTAINVPRFAVAGNSMGGGLAWGLTVAHPEKVSALILVDAAGFPNETQAKPSFAFQLLGSDAGRWLLERIETRPLTKASLQGSLLNNPVVTDEFVNRWVEVQLAPGHRHILMNIMGAIGQSDTAALANITAPTLVQWGEGDPLLQVSSAHRFAEAIPNAELILYPDVGHMPQVEIPQRSAEDARAFLRRHLLPGQAAPAAATP